jgi:hypothetical protein
MNSLNILFIGNSYTYYNGLPSIISQLADSSTEPHRVETHMVASGRKSLEWHYNNQDTLETIRRAIWDIVVLQEFSTRPVDDRDRMFEYAEKLDREIKLSGARTALYLTWARRHIPEMQESLSDAYITLARKLNAIIVPVGIAWQYALQKDPDLALHKKDKSHPTGLGSYLAACVFYSTLFQTSPFGLTGAVYYQGKELIKLPPDRVTFVQELVWEVVQRHSII